MMPVLASPTMAPSSPASRPRPTGGLRPALTPAPGGANGQLSRACRAEGQDQQSKIRSTDVSTVWGYSRSQSSMGRPGSALDNAVIESWHSTLEFELRSLEQFDTRAAARARVSAWIEDYNTRRRHSALGMMTPVRYEQALQEQAA